MKYLSLLLFAILISHLGIAKTDDIFSKPQKEQLVIDLANVFSETQLTELKQKLHLFSNETSTQILIYTTPNLQGYDVADFAQQLGEKWGIGNQGFNNGIVIVFKPKNETPGQITLQTGYGIEHLIPDATANQIIQNEMIPEFKLGNVYNGINNAVDVCISLTKEEYSATHYSEQTSENEGSTAAGFIILMVFLFVFFTIFKNRKNKYYTTGSKSNLPLWTALFLMGNSSGKGSGWSNFSGGSGSFGGGSSFGGFGGGSFGGGGASGSW